MKKVFISYSHDSDNHKLWVKKVANELERHQEIHIIFDQYDLSPFSDKDKYMEDGVYDSELIIIVATEKYASKANERKGGVGIETSLTSARHWEEYERGNKSNIVILKRGKDKTSIPNYLKSKLYIDFSDDNQFEKSMNELLKIISHEGNIKRPEKTKSINSLSKTYLFTRAEDLLKINYKKRNQITSIDESIDYSKGNKIKYEFWEVSSPKKHYFLFLYDNIIIRQVIERFIAKSFITTPNIEELTILRSHNSDIANIRSIFKENNIEIKIDFITIDDFVWEYCIDEDIKNNTQRYFSDFFVDQDLLAKKEDEKKLVGEALLYLYEELRKNQQNPAKIIIAPGGMGKTTLCHNIVNKLRDNYETVSIFITSEAIKQSQIKDILKNGSIESIYDLYHTIEKINYLNNEETELFDKNTFELGVICGKIVVVIDGLDEFISIFQERFSLEKFIESITDLNNQLGKSKILITSRDNIIDDSKSDDNEMAIFYLLGFDDTNIQRYLKWRFRKYHDKDLYIRKANSYINEIIESTSESRIFPFFVDLISTLLEDHEGEINEFSFKFSLVGKDYESNSDLIDSLVYSVLRREKTRQKISLSTYEIITVLQELAVENGESFSIERLEDKTNLYFDDQNKKIAKKISRNPLLINKSGFIKFKYNTLSSYFLVLYIIDSINHSSNNTLFLECLAKYPSGEDRVFKEVVKYFSTHNNSLLVKIRNIIQNITSNYNDNEKRKKRIISKAVSCLLHLFHQSSATSYSKTELMDAIKYIYNSTNNTIYYLFINGEFPTLNFSGMKIWHSEFINYKKFPYGEFSQCCFYYCRFKGVYAEDPSESFRENMFDTCDLGELQETIVHVTNKGIITRETAEVELKKFLSSFFNNGKFKDNKKLYIKFSTKIEALKLTSFDTLIKSGIIEIAREKSDEIYYGLARNYHKSVYDLIVNNKIDLNINSILVNKCLSGVHVPTKLSTTDAVTAHDSDQFTPRRARHTRR